MTTPEDEISLLAALDIALFEQRPDGRFCLVSKPPKWVAELLADPHIPFSVEEIVLSSPFLADFCRETEDFWTSSGTILESGIWSQRNLQGDEITLEAWALRCNGRRFVMVRLSKDFDQQRAVFQKLRDTALAYERLGRKHTQVIDARDALEMKNREVERINELKSDFLASMSHELRTPLNAIVGFSKLLGERKAGKLNEEQHDYVQHIARASEHLLQLVNDVLDLSKIEAGRLELDSECFAFSEALRPVLSTIRPLARAKNIRIKADADPQDTIYADRLRFSQILLNLLSNAIKFTPAFGEVCIKCSQDDEFCTIAVIDNGRGIPLEEQDAIFQKFHRVQTSSGETIEGTGLGLAITRALIEQHGGRIWVESDPGSGACFRFSLPRACPAEQHLSFQDETTRNR